MVYTLSRINHCSWPMTWVHPMTEHRNRPVPRLSHTSEYPDPRIVTPRPSPFSIQPNSLRICWL